MNRALGASLLFCMLFGLQIVLQSQFVRGQISPLQLLFLTNSLCFFLLTMVLVLTKRPIFPVVISQKTAIAFLAGTALWIVADIASLVGFTTSSSVNFSIISRLQLFMTYVGTVLFLGERFVGRKALALLLAFAGTILAVYSNQAIQMRPGDLLFLVFALAISGSGLLRQKVGKHVPVLQATYYMFGISALVSGILVYFFAPIHSVPVPGFIAINAVLGLVGFGMVNYAIARGGAAQFAMVSSLLPFMTVVFAYLVLRETPTLQQCLGGVVILLSIVLFVRNTKK